MHKITPFLWFDGRTEAAAQLQQAYECRS